MYDEKIYKNTVDNLLDNNKYYLEVNNQDRVFKHNIIHRLNSIKSVGDKDANKLIDDLIDDYNLNSMPNMSIDILPNGINGIISRIIYGRKIDGLQIAVNNYLKSDLFSVLSPRKYNKLCESIGVCLDNALTATSSSKEKVLQVAILESKSSVIVKIINTFDSSLEVDKLGVMNYTTKKGGHGLGIYSLLGRKDVIVKTSIINDLFENQIIVKK
jgi:sensor histidine kinase regulating citrate/malate metabolism